MSLDITAQITVSILIFLIGAIVIHRLTLWRERRREFNDRTRDTYRTLVERIKTNNPNPVSIDVEILCRYFDEPRRTLFREAVERYQQPTKTSDYDPSTGKVTNFENNINEKIKHTKNLLPYLEPR